VTLDPVYRRNAGLAAKTEFAPPGRALTAAFSPHTPEKFLARHVLLTDPEVELRRLLAIVSVLLVNAAWAGSPSLCRLDYNEACEAPQAVSLATSQRALLQEWSARYASLSRADETILLALSDLPQAIRHVVFLDQNRVLSPSQVKARLRELGCDPDGHPVWRTILGAMPTAFGGIRRFYAGLEQAIHRLIASDPGKVAALRREMASEVKSTEATKTEETLRASESALPEKAPQG